jgi:hypothetical protein
MANTPRPPASRALELAETAVIDALNLAASETTEKQRDVYCENLTADIRKGHCTAVRQILALLDNYEKRGTPTACLLAVSDAFETFILSKRAVPVMKYDDAHIAAEAAEGEREVAEGILRRDRNYPAFQSLLLANHSREIAAKAEIEAARAEVTHGWVA